MALQKAPKTRFDTDRGRRDDSGMCKGVEGRGRGRNNLASSQDLAE